MNVKCTNFVFQDEWTVYSKSPIQFKYNKGILHQGKMYFSDDNDNENKVSVDF